MIIAKQSTALVISFGPFVLFSDGVTLVTNLVGTGSNQTENTSTGIRISKNGGAFAARHATAAASTYDAFGNYLVTLDTTDMNTCGVLRVQFANAAAFCPVWIDIMIWPAMMYDSIVGGTDRLDTNVTHVGDTAQTARDLGASVLLSSGTGTGQLDFTSGVVKANLAQILGTALTETAGLLAGGFKKFFNISSPVSTMDVLARVTLTDTVTTYTGNTVQTGDAYAVVSSGTFGNAAIKTVDDAIKVQTDKLAFTVANKVDANTKSINDTTVQGNGTSGNLWRG